MTLTITRQMFTAEVLKLRRQRVLMAFAAFLSLGVVVIFMGYLQLRHASNPSQYAPAGGMDGFRHLLRALGVLFGALVATLVGTEAGTADHSSGVFRDLVATGRSRLSLFAVRVPAAVAVTWVLVGAAYCVGLVAVFLFAGGSATPSLTTVLEGAAWLALATGIVASLAVGVGALSGSRALTLTAVIGLETIVTQLLLSVDSLGSARDALLTPAVAQISPVSHITDLTMTTGVAIAVLAGWALVPALVGAWRTNTRDA